MKKRMMTAAALIIAASLGMTGCSMAELDTFRDLISDNSLLNNGGTVNSKSNTIEAEVLDGGVEVYEFEMSDGLYGAYPMDIVDFNTEEYKSTEENGFRSVLTTPLSTFGVDVDTASYANLRRMLNWGYEMDEIPSGAVRTEEILNYFNYNYQGPNGEEPFGVNSMISECPWNNEHKLLRIGLQTEKIDFSDAPDSNLVFLIDVSGSMEDYDKLPLLKKAFKMLVDELGEKDRVSIVTYAGYDEIVLEGARGDQKEEILQALDDLEAYGSTNGGEGIISAYKLAEENFIEGGNNRVILATDGDLNVGLTSESELTDLISKKKESGVYLSVLGFGTGNYSDTNLEALADKGNGNYSYIDSEREAKKVLVEELGATLVTVAKDVKLQIEFNPAYVSQYRQIGYENREMAAEDFDNDEKDGGEIGAGHSVTVLYEIVPTENTENSSKAEKSLKYQKTELADGADQTGEWMTLSIRYKKPEKEQSELLEYPIGEAAYTETPDDDFVFQAAAAEFAMCLTDSEYLGSGNLRQVRTMLKDHDWDDEYKTEFVDMVENLRQ